MKTRYYFMIAVGMGCTASSLLAALGHWWTGLCVGAIFVVNGIIGLARNQLDT